MICFREIQWFHHNLGQQSSHSKLPF
jgi:hypothetical protein